MVADPPAVDEEGRCTRHARRHGAVDLGLQGLAGRGVLHAGLDLLLAAAAGGDGGGEPVAGVAFFKGGGLTAHQAVGHVEEAVRGGAARDARRRRRDLGRRRGHVAEHQAHLAGVDVAGLELRQDVIGPMGAVAAARPSTRSAAVTAGTAAVAEARVTAGSSAAEGLATATAARAAAPNRALNVRRDRSIDLLRQLGVDDFGQARQRGVRHLHAVDGEVGRAGHAGADAGLDALLHGLDGGLVADAVVDLLLAEARGLTGAEQGGARRDARLPFLLAGHDVADDVEILVRAGAAGDQEAGDGDVLGRGREFAEDEADLVVVDVLRLELGPDFFIPHGAVAAGDRGVLHDRDLGAFGGALGHVPFDRAAGAAARATRQHGHRGQGGCGQGRTAAHGGVFEDRGHRLVLPAVARAAGGDGEDRPLSRLAVRGDVAADDGAARRPLFRAVHHALADGGRPGRRRGRRADGRLGGAGLLRPRTQSAGLRPRCGRRSRRSLPADRGRAAGPAGGGRLYRRRRGRHRLRPTRQRRRRQCRAGDEPPVRGRNAAARRAARTAPPGRPVRRRPSTRRLGAGLDGPRLGRLSAPVAAVRPVPADLRLRGAEDGGARTLSVEDEEGRAAASARPRLCADR
uniref:ANK_REP_REGION domain-containing protein n=1 Tax=Parastrongyloides trichosuri TaxID=131310 RepID=A0A0N4Z835_PARTI